MCTQTNKVLVVVTSCGAATGRSCAALVHPGGGNDFAAGEIQRLMIYFQMWGEDRRSARDGRRHGHTVYGAIELARKVTTCEQR